MVKDLREIYDPQIIRFFLATALYRRPITYTEAALEDAKVNVQQIKTAINNGYHRLETANDALPNDEQVIENLSDEISRFIEAMDDDFQAQNALTVIYEMIRDLNRMIEQPEISKYVLEFMLEQLIEMLAIFGIEDLHTIDLLDIEIDALIEEREEARVAKDFERADAIRDQLKEEGILLEDTNQGIRWKRAEK